ncbi:MAG: protein-disulfide reductase DsbD domain-containing protein, partial [bacterium]
MKPNAGAAAQPVTFPPSRKLHLPAIDETVPAYEGEIHLVRTVTLDKAASGTLTLEGSLRYQACDDRLCYVPETLALKWVIPVAQK